MSDIKNCEEIERSGEPSWPRLTRCAFLAGHGGDHYFPSQGEDASDKIRLRCVKDRADRLERGEHPDPNATDEQRYQHAERTFTNAFADCQRLRPDFRPDDTIAGELVRMRCENERLRQDVELLRAESERLRSVVDASDKLVDGWGAYVSPNNLDDVDRLQSAVRAYRKGQR